MLITATTLPGVITSGLCPDCGNSAMAPYKIAHKKACQYRPVKTKPHAHVWHDPKEYARWEKVTAQSAKEDAMSFKQLRAKLLKETLRLGKPGYLLDIASIGEEVLVRKADHYKPYGTVYEGKLAHYWTTVLKA